MHVISYDVWNYEQIKEPSSVFVDLNEIKNECIEMKVITTKLRKLLNNN